MRQHALCVLVAIALFFPAKAFAGDVKEVHQRRGGEQKLEEAADAIPGFAGLFYDDSGKLTVTMVGDEGAEPARRRFGSDVRLQRARFTFRQLQRWRNQARAVLHHPSVVYVDLDEMRNAIVVAVDERASSETRDAVARDTALRGLPDGVLVITTTEAGQDLASLTDDIRPQPGGVEIDAAPSGNCTLGFNVSFEAGQGFVTCAHCTSVKGEVNDDYVGWGIEVRDPPFWTGTWGGSPSVVCPSGRKCRFSDSALIHYAFSVENGAGARIARPAVRGTSCTQSVTISTSSPELTVTGKDSSPIYNQPVEKIGRTTGWTTGFVKETCVDRNNEDSTETYICVHRANFKVAPGDSGSPVFTWDGENGVTLMGMVYRGATSCSQLIYWADVDAIDYELGPLTIEMEP